MFSDTDAVRIISTDGVHVYGVTSVDDELFVLLERDDNQVAVYSIDDYQLLRHLHLPGLGGHHFNDITSCVRLKRLYISDYHNNCIHRFDLSSSAVSKWSVDDTPCGLSVTPSGNLLVTSRGPPNKLIELSADSGQCVREVTLQSDITAPHHAIQLTTGQLVICHGFWDDLHRVCVVNDKGTGATCSYGGQCGSDVGHLNYPCHLAVDEDSQFIFVANEDNNRVVLLSPTLEFVRDFSNELSGPCRLYFHHSTRRLYIGQLGGYVTVIQL